MTDWSALNGIEAVSLDFFNTLATHRSGDGGRGRMLMDYIASRGLQCDPWEHQVLYDVLEPHAREYSPGLSPLEKRRYLCRLTQRLFERLNVRGDQVRPEQHAEAIWERIGPRSLEVFSDVPDALRRLRAEGYRLAIISNWQCGLGHFCFELGIGDAFEHIVASAELGYAKPAREIFDEACRLLDLPPERVLHVGDSPADDVDGARAAGMHALLISRGEEAAGSVRSLDDVLDVLRPEP